MIHNLSGSKRLYLHNNRNLNPPGPYPKKIQVVARTEKMTNKNENITITI
jgi:hypothetical protein